MNLRLWTQICQDALRLPGRLTLSLAALLVPETAQAGENRTAQANPAGPAVPKGMGFVPMIRGVQPPSGPGRWVLALLNSDALAA